MKHNRKYAILAVLLFAVAMVSLLVPTYAMPSVRDGIVTDGDGIIEGTTPKVTMPNGMGGMDNPNGSDIITPDGAVTGTQNGSRTTTNAPVTSSTPASTTTRAPMSTTNAMDNDGASRTAVWGIVLAIIIAAAVIAIIFFTITKKK